MSARIVDIGTAVRSWNTRTAEELDGVVIEVVPPQCYPKTRRVTVAVDCCTRYVLHTDRGLFIRSLDQMKVIAL